MNDPLVISFSSFEQATEAHRALLDAGFDPDAVQLRVQEDESGPVEGNFLVGNGRMGTGEQMTVGGQRLGPETPYGANFEEPVWRGSHVLMVMPADDAQRSRATTLLQGLGGHDVNAAQAGAAPAA
ncbi:hypothetical protein [Piscinibacter koreensis]|uniref:Uncharacterized protein n=1 Tax=Piscinibacter koreensis TaxID=2742824 RepID=A0A7Y6TWB2_9BURK|nr:hypothetical protein [Schlegelella koreensis]NUZ05837.1 hypothetical protein [Schlegelella koreensis]